MEQLSMRIFQKMFERGMPSRGQEKRAEHSAMPYDDYALL